MRVRSLVVWLLFFCSPLRAAFFNFETATIHPIDLSPSAEFVAACNLPDGRLEVFRNQGGTLSPHATFVVSVDPVSVRFRNNDEIWVVNYISSSITVVDLPNKKVRAIISTSARPADVVFAGTPERAYVSATLFNKVQVFNVTTHHLPGPRRRIERARHARI